jgi:hypothetical protein
VAGIGCQQGDIFATSTAADEATAFPTGVVGETRMERL